jgi:hypothetical protein
MREIMQQEKEMPVADEIAQARQIQPDMNNMHWRNHRYDYYCGDWRYDWHNKVLAFDEIRQCLGTSN